MTTQRKMEDKKDNVLKLTFRTFVGFKKKQQVIQNIKYSYKCVYK